MEQIPTNWFNLQQKTRLVAELNSSPVSECLAPEAVARTDSSSSCVQEVNSFGGSSVMMWAAISNDRKTNLVHVPGNLTAERYRDEISQPHLMHVIDRGVI
jgi:glucose dehydrogenase